jgi:DeoR/GlpR family transcriptional regulator of sugar metabolism
VGSLNHNTLQRLRVDSGFFGARGVTARDGLMESELDEAQLKQQLVSASGLVIGIVDSSKFGTVSFSAFALPHEISQIITDTGVAPAIVADLRERGITVTLV